MTTKPFNRVWSQSTFPKGEGILQSQVSLIQFYQLLKTVYVIFFSSKLIIEHFTQCFWGVAMFGETKVREQASKVPCFIYSTLFKDVFSFINLEGKPSNSSVLIFILSMPGNEREKPGDSQKPKTNHSRKLFRVFCAICPLYALISCRSCEDHRVQARFWKHMH